MNIEYIKAELLELTYEKKEPFLNIGHLKTDEATSLKYSHLQIF